jgi:hypothetical protein
MNLLSFLSLLTCFTLFAGGDSYLFTAARREHTLYRTTMHIQVESDINYEGSPEALEQIRAKGVTFPMHMTQDRTMVLSSRTGAKDSKGRIPFTGRLDSTAATQTLNGAPMASTPTPLDTSLRISGSFIADSASIDSITGSAIPDQMSRAVRTSIGQMMASVRFPDTPMRIGDSFSRTIPMSIPAPGGAEVKFVMHITSTLRSMDDAQAGFDIIQEYELTTDMEKGTVKINGAGTGTMIYDKSLSVFRTMVTRSALTVSMKVGAIDVISKGNTRSVITTSVTGLAH